MEADWEFEIGGDAPVIEPHWAGFVDLRADPERARDFTEAHQLPGLADVLVRLNGMNSPVWTSKTDVFMPDKVDPDELDAADAEASHALACYVDFLTRDDRQLDSPLKAEMACRELCVRLRDMPLRRCRVDMVVRRAHIRPDANELGVTAYLTACGETESDAKSRLAECLSVFSQTIVALPG